MSLSTLQSQLAALSSDGLTTTSSKQHSDRIGRGLHYSVQQGNNNHHSSNNKYQPTLLYDTTRIAADIPLSTIQQQYQQAMQYFVNTNTNHHTVMTLPYRMALQQLSTQLSSSSSSSTTTTVLKQMILIVSSLLSECCCDSTNSDTSFSSITSSPQQHEYYLPSLYILEYMIRQYHIHTNRITMEALLWCMLPLATQLPILLHRCLLLGDWTSAGSSHSASYLWLRPYCIESSTVVDTSSSTSTGNHHHHHHHPYDATPPTLPSRSLIAISTMKHVDLLRHVCHMVRTIPTLYWEPPSPKENDDDDDDDNIDPSGSKLSSGMSHLLSYTVAIIVEGLHYLQKNHTSSSSSTILENTVRTLLPTICAMMMGGSSNSSNSSRNNRNTALDDVEEFHSWGYLIATTMMETMGCWLSTTVTDTLCHTMMVASCRRHRPSRWSPLDDPNTTSSSSSSIRQNGLLCLYSILFSNGTMNRNDAAADIDIRGIPLMVGNLPIIDNQRTSTLTTHSHHLTNHSTTIVKYIGCPSFNTFMYHKLLEQPDVDTILPQVLGELFVLSSSNPLEHKQLSLRTASLVGAILATLVQELSQDHLDQTTTAVGVSLMVSLLEHYHLQQLFWQNHVMQRVNVISSMTAFLIQAAVAQSAGRVQSDMDDDDDDAVAHYRTIILALYQCDSVQTERGIAYALWKIQEPDVSNRTTQYPKMKHLLRDILHDMGNENGDDVGHETISDTNTTETDIGQKMDSLLPPNVAMEHSDPKIRLHAIQQYKGMIESKSRHGTKHFERLFRQMISDTNISVQLVIAEMIVTWFDEKDMACHNLITEENATNTMELLLVTLYQFHANHPLTVMSDDAILLLKCQMTILGHVAQIIGQYGRDELIQLWQRSLEMFVGMMGHNDNATIQKHIEHAIFILFGDEDARLTGSSDNVFTMILDCEPFINRLLQKDDVQFHIEINDEIRDVQLNIRRRCELKVVEALLDTLRDESAMNTTEWVEQQNVYADHCFSLCMNQFRTCTSDDKITEKDCAVIKTGILESWKILLPTWDADRIPVLLTEMASTPSTLLWSCLAGSSVQSLMTNIHNRHGEKVSPYTVVFEPILRLHGDDTSSSFRIQKRLMSEAKKMITTMDKEERYDPWPAMIPALSLLQSSDRGIRIAAANILKELDQDVTVSTVNGKTEKVKSTKLDVALVKEVCRHIPIAKSHAKLDEQNFLPSFMTKCIRESSDASVLRDKLLTLCFYASLSCSNVTTSKSPDIEKYRWLSLENAVGGSTAAIIVLDAAEIAGEVAFPLISRWKMVGSKLIDSLPSALENREEVVSFRPHLAELARRCGMMIKGVTVTDPVMIVSTGPVSSRQGNNGRARSYSLGKMDGISLVSPYPDDMVKAVIDVLSLVEENTCSQFIATEILQPALNSIAWGELVFKTLDQSTRLHVAAKVIEYMKSKSVYDVPIGIPLSAYDISQILKRETNNNHQCDSILIEFIRNNVERLSSDKDVICLVVIIFDLLNSYSSNKLERIEGVELLIQDAVIALGSLLQLTVSSNRRNAISDEILLRWIDILLHLLGHGTPSKWKVVITFRARSAVLSILTNLCSHFPKRVAGSLIQASISIILNCPANQSIAQIALQAFSKIVPTFIQYASEAELSLTDFIYHFVTSIQNMENSKQAIVYGELSKVLSSQTAAPVGISEKLNGSVGALQALYLAFEAKNVVAMEEEVDQVNFAVDLLQYSSEEEQLSSLLLLLKYSIGLLSLFHEDTQEKGFRSMDKLLPTHFDVAIVASTTTKPTRTTKGVRQLCLKTDAGRKAIRTAIVRIMRTFSDGLMMDSTCESIELGIGEVSKLSLLLWQDLLLLQSLTHIAPKSEYLDDGSVQFQEGIANLVTESREFLQGKLPSHIFLASVTALIKDGGTAEIRSHALRLLAERVLTVDPYSSEALLYIDVLPNINEVIHSNTIIAKESAPSDLVLIQSAMYSIDHITRHLYIPLLMNESKSLKGNHVLESLRNCSRILLDCSNQTTDFKKMSALTVDLTSTTSLCCASLTRAVGVPSLSVLPNLMKALIMMLKVANIGMESSALPSDTDKHIARSRLTQLSILRCLLAITETIPQFLPPYLSDLLTSSTLLCASLRNTTDDSSLTVQVTETADKVCTALSKKVAARIIIPAASKALQKSILSSEIQMLMHIIEIAVDAASTGTVVSHKDDVLVAMTTSLQYDGTWEEYSVLVTCACNLLSTTVLKVSEMELRRIYQSLRRWCGDIRTDDPNGNAQRRYGFWTLSSRLGQELRTIFLPCLDMVTEDMIAELHTAVSILCPPRTSQVVVTKSAKKKQKIDHDATSSSSSSSVSPSIMSMRIVQPILAMLEHSLRADAYQGGQWTRGDNNEKFEQLLDPMGQLLFSRRDALLKFPVPSDITDPYRYLIEGEGYNNSSSSNDNNMMEVDNTAIGATTSSSGSGCSVIGCLSALALVGGNEQLWKPLNQVIMEACGNDRYEVRRAGLLCLLQLIQSLGDEYIVLLPENLPLLSELLEDGNEDVARLARDVVTQAEELLGESLEDSLR